MIDISKLNAYYGEWEIWKFVGENLDIKCRRYQNKDENFQVGGNVNELYRVISPLFLWNFGQKLKCCKLNILHINYKTT